MNVLQKIPVWMLLLYQLLGYVTITYFEQPPFYFLLLFIVLATVSTLASGKGTALSRYLWFLLLCFFLIMFSVFIYHQTPLGANKNLTVPLTYFASFLLLYLAGSYKYDNRLMLRLILVMRMTIYLAAIVSIVQYFYPSFLVNTVKYTGIDIEAVGYERRIVSIFTWGDGLFSQYLGIGIPIMYAILLFENLSKKKHPLILAAATGIVIFLSQARFAMVNYLLVTLAWFISLLPTRNRKQALLIASMLFIVFNVSIDMLKFDYNYFLNERIQSETYMTRIEAFYAAADQIPQNMLFGTGGVITEGLYRFYGRLTRIHNGFLGLWYFYGVFAAFAYYIFIFFLMRELVRGARKTHYWGSVVGMICFLFSNFTLDKTNFIEPGLMMMMIFHHYYLQVFNNQSIHTTKGGFTR